MTDLVHGTRGFGLTWASDIPLEQFDAHNCVDAPDVSVRRVEALSNRRPSQPVGRGEVYSDGFRLGWNGAAIFDVRGVTQVDYFPQPGWDGTMPIGFYSTICSLLLAARGVLPLHATAVELDGRGFLLAGPSGAGKSTLAAELLAAGARLIGDDLSAVDRSSYHAEQFRVYRGRPAMRLHPLTAKEVTGHIHTCSPSDPRGKVLVRPARRVGSESINLSGIIMLEEGGPLEAIEVAGLLPRFLFRPRWCEVMPGNRVRRQDLLELAAAVPVWRLSPVQGFEPDQRARRVAQVLRFMSG